MKAATQLTSKGQVVIPKAVRERLKWGAGTRLRVESTDDDAVVLRREAGEADLSELIARLSGCLRRYDRDPLDELEADHRAEIEADERWLRRRR